MYVPPEIIVLFFLISFLVYTMPTVLVYFSRTLKGKILLLTLIIIIYFRQNTMTSRPTVSVYSNDTDKVVGSVNMPAVFTAPIRDDLVQFCHSNMAKNRRQGHQVHFM